MGDPKPVKWLSAGSMRLAGLGVELAAAMVGFVLLGYWIDRHFQSSPWGLLICALLGVVGSVYNLIRRAVHETVGTQGENRTKPDQGRADHNRVDP